MNIKALKEKIATLQNEDLALVEGAVNEVRGLNEQEIERRGAISKEIKGLEALLEECNNARFNPVNKVEKGENKVEELKGIDREIRGLTDILRDINSEYAQEIRGAEPNGIGLPTSAPASKNIIPTTISKQILTKLEEHSSIFARVKKVTSATGNLELPARLTTGKSGFVGENEALKAINVKYEVVTLTQKRVGAYMQVTRQLILDSAFDIMSQVIEVLTKDMANAIERAIFQGNPSNKEFDGINNHIKADTSAVTDEEFAKQRKIRRLETTGTNIISLDDIMKTYQALPTKFRAKAMWTMTPETYAAVALLKDGNGNFVLQNSIVNGAPMETLFGKAIEVSQEIVDSSNTPKLALYFGDLGECYTMVIKKAISLSRVNSDTQSVLNATEMVAIDTHMDGTVDNPQSVVALCLNQGE